MLCIAILWILDLGIAAVTQANGHCSIRYNIEESMRQEDIRDESEELYSDALSWVSFVCPADRIGIVPPLLPEDLGCVSPCKGGGGQ